MAKTDRKTSWVRPLVAHLSRDRFSLTGAALTTSAAICIVLLSFVGATQGFHGKPYVGILLFGLLPAAFVLGLLMIPVGIWRHRHRIHAGVAPMDELDSLNPNSPVVQRSIIIFILLTIANLTILGGVSYGGFQYMESVNFCGTACHTVMSPEYTAYEDSTHSRVACVDCHIGPGASWFVKSKLDGTRQLFAVAFNTYSRPIPSPVHTLRPARETCEHCHWPSKFLGDKIVVKNRYAEDEENTKLTTVLVLKLGGHRANGSVGIHGRHLDAGSRIGYTSTDGRRQVIPVVTYRGDDGKLTEYVTTEKPATPVKEEKLERREMDCVDCHNRPSHRFMLPDRALDNALEHLLIPRALPFIKKKGLEVLKKVYPSRDAATTSIAAELDAYYRTTYPKIYKERKAEVDQAIKGVQAIYLRNVFPAMKLAWGSHPYNLGHEESPGCFRCHDGNHVAAGGKAISSDCDSCHQILAQEEKDPKVLKDLGLI